MSNKPSNPNAKTETPDTILDYFKTQVHTKGNVALARVTLPHQIKKAEEKIATLEMQNSLDADSKKALYDNVIAHADLIVKHYNNDEELIESLKTFKAKLDQSNSEILVFTRKLDQYSTQLDKLIQQTNNTLDYYLGTHLKFGNTDNIQQLEEEINKLDENSERRIKATPFLDVKKALAQPYDEGNSIAVQKLHRIQACSSTLELKKDIIEPCRTEVEEERSPIRFLLKSIKAELAKIETSISGSRFTFFQSEGKKCSDEVQTNINHAVNDIMRATVC